MSEPLKAADFLDDELARSDPTLDQRKVATPERHVWVRASAGSGKTKVLVDRLLRLLLPDLNGAPGIATDKILCLTFTKAGAAEMSLRLQKRLLHWSTLDDDALKKQLADLIGREAPETLLAPARQLFARVLDAPARLKIQTIHAFCQTVLGRFPIETGLSPDFKVIEEAESGEYLNQALLGNLVYAADNPMSDMGRIFSRLSIVKNLKDLQADIQQLIKEPIRLQEYMSDAPGLAALRGKLGRDFGIDDLQTITEEGFCRDATIHASSLETMAQHLANSSPGDIKRADIIRQWIASTPEKRLENLKTYAKAISDKPGGNAAKTNSDLLERQEKEKERLDRCNLAKNIFATADLMYLSDKILTDFDRHKKFMGVMDYNDLIFNTRRLLTGEFWKDREDRKNQELSTEWVLFKLDEGIDHILVDESQDTNPDQWKIIELLSAEYFSGQSRDLARPRSLFVVGDEKQSIFSFQRADPAVFHSMREYFAGKIRDLETQDGFEESLIFSFRSTAPVLRLTDAVFEDAGLRAHIGLKTGRRLRHISYRTDKNNERYGSVELWKPVSGEKSAPPAPGWQMPFNASQNTLSAEERLARRIAGRIQSMVLKGEASPGDFMILMRQRSALMHHIVRALKTLEPPIPVSGLDRIVLNETLIVQDLLAVCDFVLLPDDSFALACVLKSPFVGLSEEDLMDLSIGRSENQSLWSALRDQPDYKAIADWLFALISLSGRVQPFEFLESLLTLPCPADSQGSGYRACQRRLGADALEPLDEIISQALKLELQEIRTLQEFVAYQKTASRDIKREMEEASDQVRLMTVHGSKGLEAPIVILPDTMKPITKNKLEKFLWPDKSQLAAPLWADSKETRSVLYEGALDRSHALQLEESSRLLYVAMTRAKDTLIVCGATDKETPPPTCWYSSVKAGFDRLNGVAATPTGDLVYRISDEQPKKPPKIAVLAVSLPAWIHEKAPDETEGLIPFTPSSQNAAEDGAAEAEVYSPLDNTREHRFRRGIATHKLLQILPDLAPERREEAARRFLSTQSANFSQPVRDSIVAETLAVLSDPVFGAVFGPDSLAEVPVTGELPASGSHKARLINGQIDRLIVTASEILIVDYKTNRPSPGNPSEVPAAYRAQLKAYAEALSLIYPDRLVKCALLWTDRPLLMPMDL